MANIKRQNLLFSLFFAFLCLAISSIDDVFAADIEITGYVQGGLTFDSHGKWGGSMPFDSVVLPMTEDYYIQLFTANNLDYIDYVDDTATAGFHIMWKLTNFIYTGSSQTQGPISAANFTIFAKHNGTSPSTLIKGYDDATYNLSILPTSCQSATVGTFTFHSNFSDSVQNYSMVGSTTNQELVRSTVSCLNIGYVRFDMARLIVPQSSEAGTYTSKLTWTIIDGLP